MDTYWCNWVPGCDLLCQRPIGALLTNWVDPCCRCVPCVHHCRGQYRPSLLSLPCLRQRTKCTLWHFIWLKKMPYMWGSSQMKRVLSDNALQPTPKAREASCRKQQASRNTYHAYVANAEDFSSGVALLRACAGCRLSARHGPGAVPGSGNWRALGGTGRNANHGNCYLPVRRLHIAAFIASRDKVSASVYLVLLVAFALMPRLRLLSHA